MYGHETHRKLQITMIGENQISQLHGAKQHQSRFGNGGNAMWDQYKKTFLGMQVVILMVTAGMYLMLSREVALVATFFITLQVAAVLGAYWGDRLRKRVRGRWGEPEAFEDFDGAVTVWSDRQQPRKR
jgi:hypothetical protein